MKTLFMETTKISVDNTVMQIQNVLGRHGCNAVMIQYDDEKQVAALAFQLNYKERKIPFRLPCRWEPIFKIFLARQKSYSVTAEKRERLTEQAKRVAWRQILRWVEAQLALVNTEMVTMHEVFSPYIQVNLDGKTLYQRIEESGFNSLGLEYKP